MHYIKKTCYKHPKQTGNELAMSKMLCPVALFSTSQQSSFEREFFKTSGWMPSPQTHTFAAR